MDFDQKLQRESTMQKVIKSERIRAWDEKVPVHVLNSVFWDSRLDVKDWIESWIWKDDPERSSAILHSPFQKYPTDSLNDPDHLSSVSAVRLTHFVICMSYESLGS